MLRVRSLSFKFRFCADLSEELVKNLLNSLKVYYLKNTILRHVYTGIPRTFITTPRTRAYLTHIVCCEPILIVSTLLTLLTD